MKTFIILLAAFSHGQSDSKIKCYDCSYQISEDGDETGDANCVTVSDRPVLITLVSTLVSVDLSIRHVENHKIAQR